MPHECTNCGRGFEDGSKEMLSGCPDCGGTTFQFRPDGPGPSEGSDDTPKPPGPDVDGVARTVGDAASTVRNLVAGGRRSDDDPGPDVEPDDDSQTAGASPERDRSGATEDPVDTGAVADTSAEPDQSQTPGDAVDTDTADTSDGATEETEHIEKKGTTEEAEPTEGGETTEETEHTEETEPTEATIGSDAASEDHTSDGFRQSGARTNRDAIDEGTDPMETDWPGDDATDEGQHRGTTDSDTAQLDTRDGIVEADETVPSSGNPQDRPPVPDPRPLSARSEDEDAETDAQGEDDGTADVPGEDSEDQPSVSQLRAELNDQFESIRVVAPGQYELNLMELYDRQEYIVALQEDGKYTVQIPDRWE